MAESKKTNDGNWANRFGKLESVADHTDKNGKPFVSFKLACTPKKEGMEPFVTGGTCFGEKEITFLKANVGNDVWMRGPETPDTYEGKQVKNFKAVIVRESTAKEEAPAEAA